MPSSKSVVNTNHSTYNPNTPRHWLLIVVIFASSPAGGKPVGSLAAFISLMDDSSGILVRLPSDYCIPSSRVVPRRNGSVAVGGRLARSVGSTKENAKFYNCPEPQVWLVKSIAAFVQEIWGPVLI